VPRSENNKNSSGLNTRPPKIVNRKLMQGSDRINICKRCGEPCRGVVCKACEVFGCLKDLWWQRVEIVELRSIIMVAPSGARGGFVNVVRFLIYIIDDINI